MPTTNLTDPTFEQAVQEHDIVLVDFWAAWCGPCRQFAPVYEAAQAHPEIVAVGMFRGRDLRATDSRLAPRLRRPRAALTP